MALTKKSKSLSWKPSTTSQSSSQPLHVVARRDGQSKSKSFTSFFTSSTPAQVHPQPSSSKPSIPGNLAMRNISPHLYNDPAFSSDPRSHPHFVVTNPDPPSSPLPGHIASQVLSSKLPMLASVPPSNSPHESSDEEALDLPSSTSQSCSLETPPSSYESMPLFKSQKPPITSAAVPTDDVVDPSRPPTTRHTSAPGPSRDTVQVKPPRRPFTSPARTSPPAGVDLDPIDELDETNPSGFAFHHGSPYEAANKMISPPSIDMNSKLGRSVSLDRHNPYPTPIVPFVSFGASLNLRPGQVIPHNFHPYIGALPTHHPPPARRHTYQNNPQHQYQAPDSERSRPQRRSPPPHPERLANRSPPPAYTPLSQQAQQTQTLQPSGSNHRLVDQQPSPAEPSGQVVPPNLLFPNPWDGGRQVNDIQELDERDEDTENRNVHVTRIQEDHEEEAAYPGDGTLVGALGSWFESVSDDDDDDDVPGDGPPQANDAIGRALYEAPAQTVSAERPSESSDVANFENHLLGSQIPGHPRYSPMPSQLPNTSRIPVLPETRKPLHDVDDRMRSPAVTNHYSSGEPVPFTTPQHHTNAPSSDSRTRGSLPPANSAAMGQPKSSVFQRHMSYQGYPSPTGSPQETHMNANTHMPPAQIYPSERPRRVPAPSVNTAVTGSTTATNGKLKPRHLPKQLVMPAPLQGQPRSGVNGNAPNINPRAAYRPSGPFQPHAYSHAIPPTSHHHLHPHSYAPPPGVPAPKAQHVKSAGLLRKRDSMSAVQGPPPPLSMSWQNIEARTLDRSNTVDTKLKGPKRLLSKRRSNFLG